MAVQFTEEEKAKIKSIYMNRVNAKHVPETVRYAKDELKRANALPHHTKALAQKKETEVMKATEILAERTAKMKLYMEIFPGIYL